MRGWRATLRLVPLLVLLGCSDGGIEPPPAGEPPPDTTLVFEGRQARQCESDGLTPAQSAQKLITGGLDVLSTTCGYVTGIAFATVCGGGTPDILVHEIRTVNVPHAGELGFEPVESLVDTEAGTGYDLIDCDERPPVTP